MIQEEVFAVGNSMTDQLKQYKKRNLFQVLFYRVAARTFGAPKSRRRILIAPAMERAPGLAKIPSAAPEEPPEVEREGPPVPPKEEPRAPSPKAEFELGMEEEEVREYERYLAKRRELRRNLENLDDVLGWLRRKGDLSPLEAKELSRLQEQEARKGPQTQPALANQNVPSLKQQKSARSRARTLSFWKPSPQALSTLRQDLSEKQLRLVDLFHKADRMKKGKISREEFRAVLKEADFPVDEKQVEELIAAVSSEGSDCIHYKDLVKAQKVWKQETRKPTKTQLRGTKSDGTFLSVVLDNESRTGRPILHSWVYPRGEKQETLGSMRRNTPGRRSVFLTAPAADVDEMVKRDQERRPRAKSIPGHLDLTKRSRLVQTGNPAVDSHCLPSTVPGKTGEKIDEYRMLCYQEYVKSLLLCQKYNIPLTQSLLEKALLYPGDRVLHASGRKLKIRQPGASLPSRSSFRTPNPVTSSEGVGAAQQGVPKTMMYRFVRIID
ncbi:EF-hand calcium-binding domain-containing protein 12 [Latimeria chalumnae]|uniref:EF-hand calcium-binding domain-containing protein 12 n=1 Tax=Latimeria chalumnae TaxID=7897 RepID=UPI00313D13EB